MKKYFFSVITLTDILASDADNKDKNVERLQLTIYFFNQPIKKILSFDKIDKSKIFSIDDIIAFNDRISFVDITNVDNIEGLTKDDFNIKISDIITDNDNFYLYYDSGNLFITEKLTLKTNLIFNINNNQCIIHKDNEIWANYFNYGVKCYSNSFFKILDHYISYDSLSNFDLKYKNFSIIGYKTGSAFVECTDLNQIKIAFLLNNNLGEDNFEIVLKTYGFLGIDNINLDDNLQKKYLIDYDNVEYKVFEKKLKEKICEINGPDKKLNEDQLLNSIKNELKIYGFEFGGAEGELGIDSHVLDFIITDIKDFKDFIKAKECIIKFELDENLKDVVLDEKFNKDIKLNYVEDKIEDGMKILDYINDKYKTKIKFSDIDLKSSYLGYETSVSDEKDAIFSIDNCIKIKLKKECDGITKKIDKSKLLIKLKFEVENKTKYELIDEINNIPTTLNIFDKDKNISNLKDHINNLLGKEMTNYVLKENDTEVNSDKKLENGAIYTFIFKDNSNCVKEKKSKQNPPKEDDRKKDKHEQENNNQGNETKPEIEQKQKKGYCNCYKKQ